MGLDLTVPLPVGDLETVYRDLAPSQLPGIPKMGEWRVIDTGTIIRIRKYRDDHPGIKFTPHAKARPWPHMKHFDGSQIKRKHRSLSTAELNFAAKGIGRLARVAYVIKNKTTAYHYPYHFAPNMPTPGEMGS
jgi:hypothetical protein